jgi:hypothetical protein
MSIVHRGHFPFPAPQARTIYYDYGISDYKSHPYEVFSGTGTPELWHVGPRTDFPLGLTLEQACKAFWRVAALDHTYEGTVTASTPLIDASGAGYYTFNGIPPSGWTPAPFSIAANTATWPSKSLFAEKSVLARRDWNSDNSSNRICPAPVTEALFNYGRAATIMESDGAEPTGWGPHWVDDQVTENASSSGGSAFRTRTFTVSTDYTGYFGQIFIPYVDGLYWFPFPGFQLNLFARYSGNWLETGGMVSFSSQRNLVLWIARRDTEISTSNRTATNIAVPVQLEMGDEIITGTANGYLDNIWSNTTGYAPPDLTIDVVGKLVAQKYFDYGGIYDPDTGLPV